MSFFAIFVFLKLRKLCNIFILRKLRHMPLPRWHYCRTIRLEKGTANLNSEMFINVFHNFITFQATRFRKFVRKSALRRVYFFLLNFAISKLRHLLRPLTLLFISIMQQRTFTLHSWSTHQSCACGVRTDDYCSIKVAPPTARNAVPCNDVWVCV